MILVNGKRTDVLPVSDRGLQYGDGIWETLAIKKGEARQLEAHLARLQRGLDVLAIERVDDKVLKSEIESISQGQQQSVLKIIITRGSGGRGYSPAGCQQPSRILSLHAWPEYPSSYAAEGIKLALCEARLSHNPRLAGFKHLNRLEQVLARAELAADTPEGLVRDYAGHIIEATMSNVFIITQDGQFMTPPLLNCGIEGIARSCIINELRKRGEQVLVAELCLDAVRNSKAVFLTSSLIKIWPVRRFLGKQYAIPPLIKSLQESLEGIL